MSSLDEVGMVKAWDDCCQNMQELGASKRIKINVKNCHGGGFSLIFFWRHLVSPFQSVKPNLTGADQTLWPSFRRYKCLGLGLRGDLADTKQYNQKVIFPDRTFQWIIAHIPFRKHSLVKALGHQKCTHSNVKNIRSGHIQLHNLFMFIYFRSVQCSLMHLLFCDFVCCQNEDLLWFVAICTHGSLGGSFEKKIKVTTSY